MIRLATAALVLTLSGCGAVYSPHPVGEKLAQIDPKEWNGAWSAENGESFFVEVVDRENALLRISGAKLRNDDPQPRTLIAHLRVSSNWTFISLPKVDTGFGDVRSGTWGRIRREGEMVVIWVPDAGKFGRLVADGIFPGELQGTGSSLFGSDVHLGNLTPEHMAIITSEKYGVLFLWDRPLIYRRIARQ